MKISQGKYVKAIRSDGGKLQALKLKTAEGNQTIQLPKTLRKIAEQELTVGDLLRVWSIDTRKNKQSKKKPKLQALQLIPLSPKEAIAAIEEKAIEEKAVEEKVEKKKAAKKVVVQLCQKKNCCRRGGDKLWNAFETAAAKANNAQEKVIFQVKAGGCVGGCKHGPNLRFLPANVKHYHVQPAAAEKLLKKHA